MSENKDIMGRIVSVNKATGYVFLEKMLSAEGAQEQGPGQFQSTVVTDQGLLARMLEGSLLIFDEKTPEQEGGSGEPEVENLRLIG